MPITTLNRWSIPPAVTLTNRQVREALTFGSYKPDVGLVGVYTDVERTTVSSITANPGDSFENLTILTDFTPPVGTAGVDPDVVFRNCEFKGNTANPTANGSMLKCWNSGRVGIQLWDCTLNPTTPHFWRNGINGHNYKLYRVEITRVIDALETYNTANPTGDMGVEVKGCWSHDLAWYSQATHVAGGGSSPFDGSHSDGWQVEGGTMGDIIGNRIEGFIGAEFGLTYYGTNHGTSAMLIKPDVGLITNINMQNNWLDGGAFTININNDSPDRILGNIGSISNNRFGRDSRQQDGGGDSTYTMSMPSNVLGTFDGNVYDDNDHPILVRHNG